MPDVKIIELFHDSDGNPFATTRVDGSVVTVPVKSEPYKDFIRHQAYEKGEVISDKDLKARINHDAMHAKFEGEEHPIFVRVGEFNGHVFTGSKAKQAKRIYVDLADDGRAVEVTAKGWKVVNPACKFRRAAGMLPLPTPIPGDIQLLRPFVNLDEDDYRLFLTCVIAAFRFGRPTPILLVTGEHGSGKTTLARIFRKLVDPSTAPVQTASTNERDLQIAAANSWIVNIDNQSKLSDALSDSLCRLATGSGLRTRTLYTDSDERIFNAVRPILMNSIEELATRPDFLDRTVHLHTREIKPRRPEEEMWAEFDAVAPRILGGLMDAVSCAMKNVASVTGDFPRMADFAKWSIAAAPALGFSGDEFIAAYKANREKSITVALDDSPIYLPLHRLLEDEDFRGTTNELLEELVHNSGMGYNMTSRGDLPKTAKALACILDRLIPNLRADGITVKRLGRDPVRRVQILEITKTRTAKAMATAAAAIVSVNTVIDRRNADVSATCQQFLKDALVSGPQKRRDVRRMACGQLPMPNGKPALHRYDAGKLDANAKALGVVTVDKGEDGIWWSLPEA
jgi:putative DNA primase/helicase